MATVHREGGFTFRIWSNDHDPPHVQAWKAGAVVLVNLDPVGVREVRGMRVRDVVRAVRIVEDNREEMLSEWGKLHDE